MACGLQELQAVLGNMQELSGKVSPLVFDETALKDGLIPVANMTLQDLRDECIVRGLPVEGGLAQVRSRVRVARAKERDV